MTNTWHSNTYQQNASYVAKLGEGVLEWLNPQKDELILDVGCGDGILTKKIADAGAKVIGIDTSSNMVNAAKNLGLEAHVMSATDFTFSQKFDAIFSNACLHWVKPPEKAIENIYNYIKPDGRFVAEFGGLDNIKTIQNALHQVISNGDKLNPWYFPSKKEYSIMLTKQGFKIDKIELFERLTLVDTDIAGWLKTFANPYFVGLSEQVGNFFDKLGDFKSSFSILQTPQEVIDKPDAKELVI
jgi:SAM-dependent methyltransferase